MEARRETGQGRHLPRGSTSRTSGRRTLGKRSTRQLCTLMFQGDSIGSGHHATQSAQERQRTCPYSNLAFQRECQKGIWGWPTAAAVAEACASQHYLRSCGCSMAQSCNLHPDYPLCATDRDCPEEEICRSGGKEHSAMFAASFTTGGDPYHKEFSPKNR